MVRACLVRGLTSRFLGFKLYSVALMYLAQGHGATSGDRIQDLSIRSPMLYHYTTALPWMVMDDGSKKKKKKKKKKKRGTIITKALGYRGVSVQ